MALDPITLAAAKSYSNKVGSRIQSTSYDYNTGELTFDTVDGQWIVPVNSGMTPTYKNTLDNILYDNTDETLKINGAEVLTKENIASGDLDFDGFFD